MSNQSDSFCNNSVQVSEHKHFASNPKSLDSITKAWISDLWNNQRRLVLFRHERNSDKLIYKIQPFIGKYTAKDTKNTVISCIYWDELNDFFITLPDLIYLFRCLMHLKPAMKKLIPMHYYLEEFCLFTAQRHEADTAGFFNLMMELPLPNPLHASTLHVGMIPWKTLPDALERIARPYFALSHNRLSVFDYCYNATHPFVQANPYHDRAYHFTITGDLKLMTKAWTMDEQRSCRRLVRFWYDQDCIDIKYQQYPQGKRITNSSNLIVSCIYWQECKDYFITYIDLIYLLECFMGFRFNSGHREYVENNFNRRLWKCIHTLFGSKIPQSSSNSSRRFQMLNQFMIMKGELKCFLGRL